MYNWWVFDVKKNASTKKNISFSFLHEKGVCKCSFWMGRGCYCIACLHYFRPLTTSIVLQHDVDGSHDGTMRWMSLRSRHTAHTRLNVLHASVFSLSPAFYIFRCMKIILHLNLSVRALTHRPVSHMREA